MPKPIKREPNLTKRELVVRISNETGATQQLVADVLQKALDGILDSLASEQKVELRNFGVFEVRLTRPRVGRNPKDPEHDFLIPAHATVKFKPGKVMKQRVGRLTSELKKRSGV